MTLLRQAAAPEKSKGLGIPSKTKPNGEKTKEIYVICNLEEKRIILKEDLYFVFEYKKIIIKI